MGISGVMVFFGGLLVGWSCCAILSINRSIEDLEKITGYLERQERSGNIRQEESGSGISQCRQDREDGPRGMEAGREECGRDSGDHAAPSENDIQIHSTEEERVK